ncbi:WD40 repeat domain-containing protein [Stenomitos frigidus]|uniref:WD40 repeat domain-containing protein n=1 Tax=Stenomitos frigidus TaxID=1886765 RepID=UPI0015E6C869|nr:WD40 repeat domain-containing protein [Stenomitos frigidus]
MPAFYYLRYGSWVEPWKGLSYLPNISALQQIISVDSSSVDSVTISPNGKTMATGSVKTIGIWDFQTGKLLQKLDVSGGVQGVKFSPDGQRLASVSGDNTIRIWNVSNWKLLHSIETGQKGGFGVTITSDGQTIVGASSNGTIQTWSLISGQLLRTPAELSVKPEEAAKLLDFAISADGQTLVTSYDNKRIKIWNLQTGKVQRSLTTTENISFISISPDSQTIAGCAGSDTYSKTIQTWVLNTGQPLRTFSSPDVVGLIAFSKDGRKLVGSDRGGFSGKVQVWDFQTGTLLHTFSGMFNIHALTTGRDDTIAVGLAYWGKVLVLKAQ